MSWFAETAVPRSERGPRALAGWSRRRLRQLHLHVLQRRPYLGLQGHPHVPMTPGRTRATSDTQPLRTRTLSRRTRAGKRLYRSGPSGDASPADSSASDLPKKRERGTVTREGPAGWRFAGRMTSRTGSRRVGDVGRKRGPAKKTTDVRPWKHPTGPRTGEGARLGPRPTPAGGGQRQTPPGVRPAAEATPLTRGCCRQRSAATDARCTPACEHCPRIHVSSSRLGSCADCRSALRPAVILQLAAELETYGRGGRGSCKRILQNCGCADEEEGTQALVVSGSCQYWH